VDCFAEAKEIVAGYLILQVKGTGGVRLDPAERASGASSRNSR
jgi:hypothetical protein